MYKPTTKLKVTCHTNEDYNGSWKRDEIIEELNELGYGCDMHSNWIEYILEHVLGDEAEMNEELLELIAHNENIKSITLRFGDDIVEISKFAC